MRSLTTARKNGHKDGPRLIAFASGTMMTLGVGVAEVYADSNVQSNRAPDRPQMVEPGMGVGGTIFAVVVAPLAAGLGTYQVAMITSESGAYVGSGETDRGHLQVLLPATYGVLVGLTTCLFGFVSDGGHGDCTPVVVTTTVTTLVFTGLAFETEQAAFGYLSVFAPAFGGALVYTLTAEDAFSPSIIVPARTVPSVGLTMFPVLRLDL